ncbi:MAG: hypothetical protein ACYS5V_10570 [Planctomycetota bacterium]|jgi:hypothetical protein
MTDTADPKKLPGADGRGGVRVRPRGRYVTSVVLLLIGLASGYWAIGFCGLPFLIPVAIGIYFVARRRWVVLAVLVLFSPISVAFIFGAVQYARGTAELLYMGLPGTGFHNLDPQTRCGRRTGGCLVTGGEFLWSLPHNAGVRLMAALFGPMRGSYDGPYPTREEAVTALGAADPVPLEDLLKDTVRIGGDEIRLDARVGRGLVRGLPMDMLADKVIQGRTPGKQEREWYGRITGTIWNKRCLILRVPSRLAVAGPDEEAQEAAMIVVIDRHAGRPFAYFGQGDYYHRFPPVDWVDPGNEGRGPVPGDQSATDERCHVCRVVR